MKKNKAITKITIMLILMMVFSYTTFAEVAETTTDVVENVTEESEDETLEDTTAGEAVTAIISIDLGDEVLLTVDESGMIVAIEVIEDATEEDATEEDATEEDATEEDATEEDATEEDATEEDATEEDATEEDATKEDATEEDATEEDATEDIFVSLIGLTLTDGIEILIENYYSNEDFKFEVAVYADDENLSNTLTDLIVDTFGEFVELYSEEVEDDTNPNRERFVKAKSLGISNGKMNLLNKLEIYYKDDLTVNYLEWANKSVKEIMAEIKAKKSNIDVTDTADIEDTTELDVEISDEDKVEDVFEKKSEKKSNNGKNKKK